ncbi:MAG: iron export ABC transporter permease subunit FetB [Candidatus Poribacteria bacterium]|nr:MAG: iron export ABC transporter permease subunit FetB [Candidatus Poribacteria bacterium]
MNGVLEIGVGQLLLCLSFVLVAGIASLLLRLRLERDLGIGTVRTFVQLFLVGYILQFIFDLEHPVVIVGYYVWMIFWAARAVRGRVQERPFAIFGPTFVSMTLIYVLVAIFVTGVIVQARPWYLPQYFIPLGGMIIGNSMNSISIALDRLFGEVKQRRAEIEMALALGATSAEATEGIVRNAVRAGMIPSINALMTVGLVSLPGMMTGQILAGSDPSLAVRYQIVVMLMLVASTALGSVTITLWMRRRCFSRDHQLRVR